MRKITIQITMSEEQANWFWQAMETLINRWDQRSKEARFFSRIQGVIMRHLTPPAPDNGDSLAPEILSTLEGDTAAGNEPTPAPCG